MLGLQGNASSKEYRCVACSSTFTGLSSLLVHQATHASSLPNPSRSCSISTLVGASPPTFSSIASPTLVPTILSPSMHKCDCGEEFRDFNDMMHHKQSHAPEELSPQSVHGGLSKGEGASQAQSHTVHGEGTEHFTNDQSSVKGSAADVNHDESASVGSSEGQSPERADIEEQYDKTLATEETEENDMNECVPRNKPLMKILVSAYGKHLVSPPSVDDDNIVTSLKEEPEPVVIAPPKKEASTVSDMSTVQIKRLLGKPGMKTKARSISRLLESSTKKIVSLTKMFSPVVLLETRQKFISAGSDTYGSYQCSRCRKIFQDADSLTEHHLMHKKERIKCCRCCKQLIIGKVPLPDNHVCPQPGEKTSVSSLCLKSNANYRHNLVQSNNPKKVYFCPICKRNFTRRYGLKIHKCRGPLSEQFEQIKTSNKEVCILNESNISKNIGTDTQIIRSIKVEDDSEHDLSNLSCSSVKKQHENATAYAASFLQVQNSQWTIPLNNEMEMLTYTNADSSAKGRSVRLSTVLEDGVKRYSCEKCLKTFGLSSNLCRHKRVCSVRPKDLESQHSFNNMLLNSNVPVFSCYICGKKFNRKDNMIAHRKKCEMRRTMSSNFANEMNQSLSSSNTLDQTQEEDANSWSVMSLPSVLPRRVTCECGSWFSSPKLLLEHLQKHAQESYTCPTCGVTVKSWADYEMHLQLHMHPQHHKRSQHLLLQMKKDIPDLQQCQTVNTLSKLATPTESICKNLTRKQPLTCPRCGNAFASRCTLRRHLTWSQCKGSVFNNSIKYNLFSLQHRLPKQI